MAAERDMSRTRADYAVFWPISTRWMDEDVYGHVNNVAYYSYFDSAVNGYLIDTCDTNIRTLPAIGLVAETQCRYLHELRFPMTIEVGLGVERLGRSSIVYDLGIFAESAYEPAAVGRFVHVYVDTRTREVTPIPGVIREAVQRLVDSDMRP